MGMRGRDGTARNEVCVVTIASTAPEEIGSTTTTTVREHDGQALWGVKLLPPEVEVPRSCFDRRAFMNHTKRQAAARARDFLVEGISIVARRPLMCVRLHRRRRFGTSGRARGVV